MTTIYARSSKNVLDRALVADDERADCSGLARKLLGTFLWTTVRSPHEIGAAEKAVQRLRWLAWQRAVRDATAASDAA